MTNNELITALNNALAWELRAIAMYAHYALCSGSQLYPATHFNTEVTESVTHAATVRPAIVKLDGEAITERDPTPIVHTSNYQEMLQEAYATESKAAATYGHSSSR